MSKRELDAMVQSFRSKRVQGRASFPEHALTRELVEGLCLQNALPSPWSRQENCDFIAEAIRYWGETQQCQTENTSVRNNRWLVQKR